MKIVEGKRRDGVDIRTSAEGATACRLELVGGASLKTKSEVNRAKECVGSVWMDGEQRRIEFE